VHGHRLLLAWLIVGFALGCDKKSSGEQAGAQANSGPPPKRERPAEDPAQWKVHTSEKCGFSMELPGARKFPPSDPDIVDSVTFEGVDSILGSYCMDEDLSEISSEALELAVEGFKSEWPGVTAEVESVEVQGWPGRALSFHVPADKKPAAITWDGDLEVRIRFYIVGKRVYHQQVMWGAEMPWGEKRAERYFASFRLLDPPPPPPKSEAPPSPTEPPK
jgi:hypothetical protein